MYWLKKLSEFRLRPRYRLLLAIILTNNVTKLTNWCIFLQPRSKFNWQKNLKQKNKKPKV